MPLRKAGAGSRRDRHSKILTRQGPRDRRMRLSLEIARKFFRLQDTLGFDKASKTVAWLLNNSKAAITEVEGLARMRRSPSPSSTSEYSDCQAMVLPRGEGGGGGGGVEKSGGEQKEEAKKKSVVLARKAAAFDHPLAKEWRATARAKARERTKKKMSRRMEPSAAAAGASSLNDYDDHHSSSSLGLAIKEQQLGTEPLVSNPFTHQAFLVDGADDDADDESIKPSAAAAAVADQAPMIDTIFDYHQHPHQHHLSQGVNSVNHLGSFENNDNMMINFFPDNWGELGGPSHTHAPLTTALLFKASADHHVQFCPKSLNNNAYNSQSL